jgi:hypothetical protein
VDRGSISMMQTCKNKETGLSNMVLHIISFFLLPKESYINWTITDLGYFGKEIVRKRSIDWLNGVLFAIQKIRLSSVFTTLGSRIQFY